MELVVVIVIIVVVIGRGFKALEVAPRHHGHQEARGPPRSPKSPRHHRAAAPRKGPYIMALIWPLYNGPYIMEKS